MNHVTHMAVSGWTSDIDNRTHPDMHIIIYSRPEWLEPRCMTKQTDVVILRFCRASFFRSFSEMSDTSSAHLSTCISWLMTLPSLDSWAISLRSEMTSLPWLPARVTNLIRPYYVLPSTFILAPFSLFFFDWVTRCTPFGHYRPITQCRRSSTLTLYLHSSDYLRMDS